MELRDLVERRQTALKSSREILDLAKKEDRELTAEEQTNYDRMFAAAEADEKRIKREEQLAEAERSAAESARRNPAPSDNPSNPAGGGEQRTAVQVLDERAAERQKELRTWLNDPEPKSGSYEMRALQADVDASGGYLVRGEQFVMDLIQAVDDQVFIRKLATKYTVTDAESLGAPSLDADPADADWTGEILTGSEDSTMAFGKRSLTPHPLAKRIKVSRTLLRKAAMSADAIVLARLAYKFAISEEKGFLTGTGANQPLGVFTASANGVPTTRDVSTGNTTTAFTFDGLINAQYSVKAAYWPKAEWLFHRDAVKMLATIKDGDGRYMWEPSNQVGQPDRIRGQKLNVSEYAPNTFTTGLYVGMFADFSNYWIADALSFDLQRLVELYAETNQIGFIGRQELDGMPVLAEAFARVKLA